MDAPSSLPAQLYLLAYDLEAHRMRRSDYLGRALRAAALTELYEQGMIADDGSRARVVPSSSGPARRHRPADPLCALILQEIGASSRARTWRRLVDRHHRGAVPVVRQHLADGHWIRLEQRRILGIFPVTTVEVRDRAMAHRLHQRVSRALRGGTNAAADPGAARLAALLVAGELGPMRRGRERRAVRRRIAAMEPVLGPAVPALRAAVRAARYAAASA